MDDPVGPVISKSLASNLETPSAKVTLNVTASALVGVDVGFCLSILITEGAIPSTKTAAVDPTLFKFNSASTAKEFWMLPPFNEIIPPTAIPFASKSPGCTVYLNSKAEDPEPETYSAS